MQLCVYIILGEASSKLPSNSLAVSDSSPCSCIEYALMSRALDAAEVEGQHGRCTLIHLTPHKGLKVTAGNASVRPGSRGVGSGPGWLLG